jgi:hypothetical protein
MEVLKVKNCEQLTRNRKERNKPVKEDITACEITAQVIDKNLLK